jgi:pre-rRNA-processing protein TSR4
MSLLLQLNGDLPDRYPGHERRLYLHGCRKKQCRRKDGSIRALRGVRASKVEGSKAQNGKQSNDTPSVKPVVNLGETLFGVNAPTPSQANPFASSGSTTSGANPFSTVKPPNTKTPATAQSQVSTTLAESFAQKVRISSEQTPAPLSAPVPAEPWLDDPTPYPSYYLDADKEYLDPISEPVPSNARLDDDGDGGSGSAADERTAFESSMDKTFQRFADRLAQNPEQVLRYEFDGQPLLYSKSDAVGRLLSPAVESRVQSSASRHTDPLSSAAKLPRCSSCGARRVFELQLTPHAITELEADEMGVDGMDWGTIIVGVCSEDCQEKGKVEGEIGYVEEWVGVQWEDIADGKRS